MSAAAFVVSDWAAFAAGLHTKAQWLAWAREPALPAGNEQAEVAEVPAMARRRLGLLGRAAVQVACWCQGADSGMPVVLASRYGDAARSVKLLAELARGEALSPTDFGLSVHNAIGAQYSIVRADRANYVSVAAGAASAGAALLEAMALLHDGAQEALVVCYDAPLPGDYAVFEDEPAASYAWAWRLARPAPGQTCIELECAAPAGAAPTDKLLPFGLDALRFALCDDESLRRHAESGLWIWRRRVA